MDEEAVRRWSEALRDFDVLEPWLTESHWDDHYWEDVARRVVADERGAHSSTGARAALEDALRATFPDIALQSDNGLYRDRLDQRLNAVVNAARREGPGT